MRFLIVVTLCGLAIYIALSQGDSDDGNGGGGDNGDIPPLPDDPIPKDLLDELPVESEESEKVLT